MPYTAGAMRANAAAASSVVFTSDEKSRAHRRRRRPRGGEIGGFREAPRERRGRRHHGDVESQTTRQHRHGIHPAGEEHADGCARSRRRPTPRISRRRRAPSWFPSRLEHPLVLLLDTILGETQGKLERTRRVDTAWEF